MSPVHVIKPESFAVIDFLNALSATDGYSFKVIDPETGEAIEGEVLNLKVLGLSIKSKKKRASVGFPVGNSDSVEVYAIGASLNLVPIPAGTLPGIENEAWEMIVEDAEEVPVFVPIADALSKEFGVVLVLNPYSKDDDSDHLEPVPANPDFPDGPQVCRVLPRK